MAGEFTKYLTVSSLMTRVMGELGLTTPAAFNGSTDLTVTQILKFLTSAGQDLCTMTDWQYLHKEWTQVLTPGTFSYALPTDWNGFVSGAMWDNTSRWPVLGPLTPQIWRMMKARLVGGTNISLQYRIIGNLVTFLQSPPADTIVSDYYSRGWIIDGVQVPPGTIFRDNVANDSDTLLFDASLLTPMIKYRWRNAKGFDTTSDSDEFQAAWDIVVGRDSPAATLSIGNRSTYPFLGYANMPDTNYGS